MAIAAAMDQAGDTKELLERYDKVSAEVLGLGHQAGHTDHYCLETSTGIRIVNIFDTEQQLRAFYDRPEFRDVLKKGGVEYHEPTVMKVHNARHF